MKTWDAIYQEWQTDDGQIHAQRMGLLIRCEDCKYFEIINGFEECNRYADETGSGHSTQPYGFCWLAERKEE